MALQNKGMHDLRIPDDGYRGVGTEQTDYSTYSQDRNTRVLFKDLEYHLVEYIQTSDIVVGCVAWLTSEPILHALAGCKGVSIIVQKEDFLRPDFVPSGRRNWARWLRTLYDRLPPALDRQEFGNILGDMSCCADPGIKPVRCIGNYNADKSPAFPRSHHKFVLFCDYVEGNEDIQSEEWRPACIEPRCVWTGSFNFTKTAGMSFENAIVSRDPEIVKAYYCEYGQVAALSEPLDWESRWSEPEWRIGT